MEKLWRSKILDMELLLCDKMLSLDERNFHCWNYRLWVTELYVAEIQKRLPKGAQAVSNEFILSECDMAEKIIRKNFSNYSAWHYRGKLMPQVYKDEPSAVYSLPLDRIKKDLDLLKHAFFTDPKDQSPWNYHNWLISLISPIQVVAMRLDSLGDQTHLVFGLSHQVKDFSHLDISLLDQEGTPVEFTVIPICRGGK